MISIHHCSSLSCVLSTSTLPPSQCWHLRCWLSHSFKLRCPKRNWILYSSSTLSILRGCRRSACVYTDIWTWGLNSTCRRQSKQRGAFSLDGISCLLLKRVRGVSGNGHKDQILALLTGIHPLHPLYANVSVRWARESCSPGTRTTELNLNCVALTIHVYINTSWSIQAATTHYVYILVPCTSIQNYYILHLKNIRQ